MTKSAINWKALAKKLWRELHYHHSDCVPLNDLCPNCYNFGWRRLDLKNPSLRVACKRCNYEWNTHPEKPEDIILFFESWEKDLRHLIRDYGYKICLVTDNTNAPYLMGGVPDPEGIDSEIINSFMIEWNMDKRRLEVKLDPFSKPMTATSLDGAEYLIMKHLYKKR